MKPLSGKIPHVTSRLRTHPPTKIALVIFWNNQESQTVSLYLAIPENVGEVEMVMSILICCLWLNLELAPTTIHVPGVLVFAAR